jgi:hypothetical protein
MSTLLAMLQTTSVIGIAQVIQQAVAPVFLLTGVAAMLTVQTNRLARVIDRARQFEIDYHALTSDSERKVLRGRLAFLSRRARYINRAITLCTLCALLVCVVIMTLFVAVLLRVDASRLIAGLFIVAMLTLIGGLLAFLQEIFLATASVRIDPPQDRAPTPAPEAS